jgi:hypothetical protein
MRMSLAWVAIISLIDTFPASAAAITVADNLPPGDTIVYSWEEVGLAASAEYTNGAKGQSFNAAASGQLHTLTTLIGAGIEDRIPQSPPLNISFCTAVNGVPLERLATVTMAAEDFQPLFRSDNFLETIDFTSFDVGIIAGREYMVLYECPYGISGPNANYAPYLIGMIVNGEISLGHQLSYALDGRSWLRLVPEPMYTFELATQVSVVPEPESAILTGISIFLATVIRRRPRVS